MIVVGRTIKKETIGGGPFGRRRPSQWVRSSSRAGKEKEGGKWEKKDSSGEDAFHEATDDDEN